MYGCVSCPSVCFIFSISVLILGDIDRLSILFEGQSEGRYGSKAWSDPLLPRPPVAMLHSG